MNGKIKILSVFLFTFFLTTNLLGQDYKYIRKAERLINSNINLNRAIKLLDKAENVNYGFCGNAWATAFWNINYLKARAYDKKEQYSMALAHLDSIKGCSFGGDCESSDALKYEILGKVFDNDEIKKALLEKSDSIISFKKIWMEKNICVYLDSLNYNICFTIDPDIFSEKRELTLNEVFIKMNIYSKFE